MTAIHDIRRRLRPVSAQITTRMGRFAPAERAYRARRCELAKRYLRGSGLEIGALNCPLPMPPDASVRYVDRMSLADLRHHYPELEGERLVTVDVVDDGERLTTQPDGSADFIVANHFIEHTEDPLGTIANHLRVLRTGGILYMAVPNRCHTFDDGREPTALAHLARDYHDGPRWSRRDHYEEWVKHMDALSGESLTERAAALERESYSIHFHVWTASEFADMLDHACNVERFPFTIEALEENGHEFIAILRHAQGEVTNTTGTERLGCPVCDGESHVAFAVGDRNRGLGPVRVDYRHCEACGTCFAAEIPADLGRYYEADGYGTGSDHFVEEFVRREQAKVELVRRFVTTGRMVEIGPGPGMFARAAVKAGYQLSAIEMDPGYCRYLTEELGVEVINSDTPVDVLRALPPSQAIVMWHVIEHLPRPGDVLRAAAENLELGGVLAISTPNPGSLQFRLLGRYWAHLDAPRHLQLIPHATLQRELAALGMRHVLTTTTDPVGLECNRLGWEYAIRRHPARRSSSATSMRLAKLISICIGPVERRGLLGAAYTSLFVKDPSL